jgi:hypothetical protein
MNNDINRLLIIRLAEIICFLQSCDSKECIYDWQGLQTKTVEIENFRGDNETTIKVN